MSHSDHFDRREVLLATLALGAVGCSAGGDSAFDELLDSGLRPSDGWATGGTASLAGDYELSFSSSCSQTCELTLGPCYAETVERRDISEGFDGLPTQIGFRVVDTDCNPVAGAVVDIWHCAPSGLYSGSDAARMCTNGDSEAVSNRWFRGTQTTDADGVVRFDTCMPGWYSSRAVHIHFQVRVGGQAYVTSQLGFPEALLADVFTTHPVYSPFGLPDTSNSADNILSRDLESYLFEWRAAEDGALLLTKTLTVRTSLSERTC